MFTDMVGYSKLTGDDQLLALELLKEHDKIIEPIIKKYEGLIVKRIGDAIVATFNKSEDIINSSVEIQIALKKRNINNTQSRQIVIRIGLHYGYVELKNNEVYGLGYDIASNIEPIGEFGGIAFSHELYKESNENNELIVNGKNNHFFVRPIAKFNFKVCPNEIIVYKLYLSLLDWYDEPSSDAHLYLDRQNINSSKYEFLDKNFYFSDNSNHLKLAHSYLQDHNLSLCIYHLKMHLENNLNEKVKIDLQIIHIFCSIGLTRMVDRLCSNINHSNYLDYIKGLNYFNKKDLSNSQIYFENSLEEKNDTSYFLDANLYLLIIYFKAQNFDKGLDLLNFHKKFFNTNNFAAEFLIIKTIFTSYKSNKYENTLPIKLNILDMEPILQNQKILIIYWFLIQYYQKIENFGEALKYQDSARTLITGLTYKISGYQIKETFNQSPFLHQMLMEEIDIIFNSTKSSKSTEELLVIEDDLNSSGATFKFCPACGFDNQKSFKFCPSCGHKLTN